MAEQVARKMAATTISLKSGKPAALRLIQYMSYDTKD
jgi:hypothetical protein